MIIIIHDCFPIRDEEIKCELIFQDTNFSIIDCFPIHNQLKIEENNMDRHWILSINTRLSKKLMNR